MPWIFVQLPEYFPLQCYANVTGPRFCYGSNIPYLGHAGYDDPKGTCECENSRRTQGKLTGLVPGGFNVIAGPGPTEDEMLGEYDGCEDDGPVTDYAYGLEFLNEYR